MIMLFIPIIYLGCGLCCGLRGAWVAHVEVGIAQAERCFPIGDLMLLARLLHDNKCCFRRGMLSIICVSSKFTPSCVPPRRAGHWSITLSPSSLWRSHSSGFSRTATRHKQVHWSLHWSWSESNGENPLSTSVMIANTSHTEPFWDPDSSGSFG